MKRSVRLIVSLAIGLLIVSLCFAEFPQMGFLTVAKASPTLTFTGSEYSNGTITPPNSPLKIWYTWINVSGTQIVNYAMYTPPNYPYPVPIASLIGQHLQLADGSDVFVASALDGMEVYRNSNGGGIPDSAGNQILYFMYSNMSDSYQITPIEQVSVGGVNHYRWGYTYEGVYAYLQDASTHLGVAVTFKLDHLTLSYDFSVNGNTSDLKTGFDIGAVSDIHALDQNGAADSGFSFDGLSLSLLYASETYASAPYSTYVNGQPYNSTTTTDPTINADNARVGVADVAAYDFIFGGNYTLGQTAGTQDAKAEVAAPSSLPFTVYGSTVQGIGFFNDELNLNELFGGSWPALNIQYSACALVYRICFPTWGGQQITYDPLYVGYMSGGSAITTSPVPEFPATAASIAVVLVAGAALFFVVKRKRAKI